MSVLTFCRAKRLLLFLKGGTLLRHLMSVEEAAELTYLVVHDCALLMRFFDIVAHMF